MHGLICSISVTLPTQCVCERSVLWRTVIWAERCAVKRRANPEHWDETVFLPACAVELTEYLLAFLYSRVPLFRCNGTLGSGERLWWLDLVRVWDSCCCRWKLQGEKTWKWISEAHFPLITQFTEKIWRDDEWMDDGLIWVWLKGMDGWIV